MSGIRLIAGLGNIGAEHEDNRHNAGFWLVDRIARGQGAVFSKQSRFFGEVSRLSIGGESVHLIKPSTYMNRSGQAVAAVAQFYRIAPESILVVHDELDLAPGMVKLKQGGGHAGHNGLRDIIARLGSAAFWRLRLGIGHPRTLALEQDVADFVLHRPSRDDQSRIDQAIDQAIDGLDDWVTGRMEQAMKRLHTTPRS
jgi:PTH1 family peptidyl-tRNA hydrolase